MTQARSKNLIIFAITGTLTGCMPTYNLSPKYDENAKTVTFGDSLTIDSVIHHEQSYMLSSETSMAGGTLEGFKTNDEKCKSFVVRSFEAGGNWQYDTSMKTNILKMYNDRCSVERIGNLHFLECDDYKTDYFVCMSEKIRGSTGPEAVGYESKLLIQMPSKCYHHFKDHFSSITPLEYIKKIVTYDAELSVSNLAENKKLMDDADIEAKELIFLPKEQVRQLHSDKTHYGTYHVYGSKFELTFWSNGNYSGTVANGRKIQSGTWIIEPDGTKCHTSSMGREVCNKSAQVEDHYVGVDRAGEVIVTFRIK